MEKGEPMLKTYEAVFEHGQIHWINQSPSCEFARVMVTVLAEQKTP